MRSNSRTQLEKEKERGQDWGPFEGQTCPFIWARQRENIIYDLADSFCVLRETHEAH